jgi:hypothetical protein
LVFGEVGDLAGAYMTFSDQFGLALGLLIQHTGTILVSLVGLLFAIARRRQLGRVSAWATWGFSLFLAYVLVRVVSLTVVQSLRIGARLGPTDGVFTLWVSISGVVTGLLYLCAFSLLACAVFLDRSRRDGENLVALTRSPDGSRSIPLSSNPDKR